MRFSVLHEPLPQPRPRVYRGRACGDDKPLRAYKDLIKLEGRLLCRDPEDGPIFMRLGFDFLRPARPARPYPNCQSGDLDNLAKAVLDALEGIVFVNDTQVVELTLRKRWADVGQVHVSWEWPEE